MASQIAPINPQQQQQQQATPSTASQGIGFDLSIPSTLPPIPVPSRPLTETSGQALQQKTTDLPSQVDLAFLAALELELAKPAVEYTSATLPPANPLPFLHPKAISDIFMPEFSELFAHQLLEDSDLGFAPLGPEKFYTNEVLDFSASIGTPDSALTQATQLPDLFGTPESGNEFLDGFGSLDFIESITTESLGLDFSALDKALASHTENEAIGIMHDPHDVTRDARHDEDFIPNLPDSSLQSDPTMKALHNTENPHWDFPDVGLMIPLLRQSVPAAQSSPDKGSPNDVPTENQWGSHYTALERIWANATVSPDLINLPRPDLKRKGSDVSDESNGVPGAKRPRGRPPKSRSGEVPPPAQAKRPYRRQSNGEATPMSRSPSAFAAAEASSPKLTVSGKASTARPKSVVPDKYLKDGTAAAILGMTIEEIQAFPTYEELLKKVEPSKHDEAYEFGLKISGNRDKAKDAAKKSREERKAKIDGLERTVSDLETKIGGMQAFIRQLVARGAISESEASAHLV